MSDYKIRCISKGVPPHLQFIYGWLFEFRGRHKYTGGGITKNELIFQLDRMSWAYWMQW